MTEQEREEEHQIIMLTFTRRRMGRIVQYAGHSLAGLIGLIFPVEVVRGEVGTFVVLAWAGALFFAAAICLTGAVLDRWIGEYVALPLLIGVMLMYGGAGLAAATTQGFPSFVFGVIVCSFACGMIGRWFDCRDVKHADAGLRSDSPRR